MSVPPGGAATINGIIYQLLWSLLEGNNILDAPLVRACIEA
jgi:hypothetical protein